MKKFLLKLFNVRDYKEDFLNSLDRINDLYEELTKMNDQLLEKQEHINKTNAYWKGVVRDLKSSKKAGTPIKKERRTKKID